MHEVMSGRDIRSDNQAPTHALSCSMVFVSLDLLNVYDRHLLPKFVYLN